jgi:hypothetical protein
MCVTSAVMQQWWPPSMPAPTGPDYGRIDLPPPNAIPWPQIEKDPNLAAQMLEVLKRLEAIDKRLGLIEQCKVAEPEKKKVKARLRRIAKKAGKP